MLLRLIGETGDLEMKKLLATTALVAATSMPLVAGFTATAALAETQFLQTAEQTDFEASNLIGARLYTSEKDYDGGAIDQASDDWNDVGEINDLLLSKDGQVRAVLVDIGGFLGIGEKTVAVDMSNLKMVQDNDDPDDYFIVLTATKDVLDSAPMFEEGDQAAMSDDKKADDQANMDADTDANAQAAATTDANADDANADVDADAQANADANTDANTDANAQADNNMADGNAAMAPTIKREGYTTVAHKDLSADMVEGARVYDVNEDDIGEVSKLLMTKDGKINAAVVDVGGFLGMGEKPVELKFDRLTIIRNDNGDDVRVYVDTTEDALKEMPDYEERS
jgi:hypothetical protein